MIKLGGEAQERAGMRVPYIIHHKYHRLRPLWLLLNRRSISFSAAKRSHSSLTIISRDAELVAVRNGPALELKLWIKA